MDSISQLALGAALGELVLGRSIGRRAAVLGAALGTLPDLDVLVPYADAVDSFTLHRSWSHSVFVLTVASLPIAALVRRVVGRAPRLAGTRAAKAGAAETRSAELRYGDVDARRSNDAGAGSGPSPSFAHWWFGVWLVLFTHPLLDAFTVYGTQIWWPLPVRPVAIGSVFIIDPLYTLPLVVGLVWLWRRRTAAARRANVIGLAASTAYLAVTLLVQAHVAGIARSSLVADVPDASGTSNAPGTPAGSDGEGRKVLVVPLPLSILWRVVALDGPLYREGWYSVFDDEAVVRFTAYERGGDAFDTATAFPSFRRLAWFTDGFVRVREEEGELVATDLRMGAESNYVFSFVVGEREGVEEGLDGGIGGEGDRREGGRPVDWRPIVARERAPEIDLDGLAPVLRRALDEDALTEANVPGGSR